MYRFPTCSCNCKLFYLIDFIISVCLLLVVFVIKNGYEIKYKNNNLLLEKQCTTITTDTKRVIINNKIP